MRYDFISESQLHLSTRKYVKENAWHTEKLNRSNKMFNITRINLKAQLFFFSRQVSWLRVKYL